MKKICYLIVLLIVSTIQLQAQAPTTIDEYTYVIVGYKQQLNLKLEMKNGYSIKDVDQFIEEDRRIEFKSLFRDKEKSPCAIMMIYYLPRGAAPLYYCIPTFNASSEIWDKFYKDINSGEDNPQQRLKFFALSISRIMMKINAEGR